MLSHNFSIMGVLIVFSNRRDSVKQVSTWIVGVYLAQRIKCVYIELLLKNKLAEILNSNENESELLKDNKN